MRFVVLLITLLLTGCTIDVRVVLHESPVTVVTRDDVRVEARDVDAELRQDGLL